MHTATREMCIRDRVDAVQTVELYKNDNSIVIEQAVDYRKRVLKKGSRVCLDFGNHQVGYLTLNLNYRGSHPDAPVWLKLHFAENATELFEDGKSYQGWICSSWIEEEQLHVDVVPCLLYTSERLWYLHTPYPAASESPCSLQC